MEGNYKDRKEEKISPDERNRHISRDYQWRQYRNQVAQSGCQNSRDGGHAAYLHPPIELLLATCGYYRWPTVFILFN